MKSSFDSNVISQVEHVRVEVDDFLTSSLLSSTIITFYSKNDCISLSFYSLCKSYSFLAFSSSSSVTYLEYTKLSIISVLISLNYSFPKSSINQYRNGFINKTSDILLTSSILISLGN